jgi:hypothetical protein
LTAILDKFANNHIHEEVYDLYEYRFVCSKKLKDAARLVVEAALSLVDLSLRPKARFAATPRRFKHTTFVQLSPINSLSSNPSHQFFLINPSFLMIASVMV